MLLDVSSKDEADDLAPEERKFLAGLAEEYRAEAIAAGTRRKRGKPGFVEPLRGVGFRLLQLV